jgi:hypothetical protein
VRTIEKSETPFRIAVALAAVVLALLILRMRFCYDVELASLPPRPVPRRVSAAEVNRTVEASPEFYADHVAKDAVTYGLTTPPKATELGRALPYKVVSLDDVVLDPADKNNRAEALGLVLRASVQSIEDRVDRQIVLSIENTTDTFLAYRVTTRPTRGVTPCSRKQDLPHDAIAIAPHKVERRSECLWSSGWKLQIERIETIELPELSYHYVSLLPAGAAIGFDPRTSRGHLSPDHEPLCRLYHSGELENHIRGGMIGWRDIVDFYSRHRCKTYTMSAGYRAVPDGQTIALPATARPK